MVGKNSNERYETQAENDYVNLIQICSGNNDKKLGKVFEL